VQPKFQISPHVLQATARSGWLANSHGRKQAVVMQPGRALVDAVQTFHGSVRESEAFLLKLLSVTYREEDPCNAREHRVIALELPA
jgi:hypothetical protein